jgi:glycosyltransferase involved in cell wall biosynthesis
MEKLEHKISYIIIGCNQAEYLDNCLSSISNQTPPPFEIIYVDSSTDDSMKVAGRYTPNVYFIEKCGANPARNYGASKATGDFLVFVDADNELSEKAAEEINKEIKSGLRVGPLSWASRRFSLREVVVDVVLNRFAYKAWPACLVEKELFERAGGFQENYAGINDIATIGLRLRHISPAKRMKAGLYTNKDPFYEKGFWKRLAEWLK